LAATVDRYLEMINAQRSPRTYISYRYTLKELLVPSYQKSSLDQVTREDILAFMARCYAVDGMVLLAVATQPQDRGRRRVALQKQCWSIASDLNFSRTLLVVVLSAVDPRTDRIFLHQPGIKRLQTIRNAAPPLLPRNLATDRSLLS